MSLEYNQKKKMQNQRNKKGIILGGMIIAVILGLGSLLLLNVFPSSYVIQTPTAHINRLPFSTVTMTSDTEVELAVTNSVDEDLYQIGSYVQIAGTDGEGLRFRADSSITADVLFIAMDSEAFLVQKGPTKADGYDWYYLTAPYDKSRAGWAASEYFILLAAPEP